MLMPLDQHALRRHGMLMLLTPMAAATLMSAPRHIESRPPLPPPPLLRQLH